VDLDSRHFKTMQAFEERFPFGAPSLVAAESLTVKGDWTFGADVVVTGAVTLADAGAPQLVPDGSRLGD
jgi:UTP--glucose-1-phosphate uridylyltransferase